jgi:pimeloyl-ACP methyl ester carboxylesterase
MRRLFLIVDDLDSLSVVDGNPQGPQRAGKRCARQPSDGIARRRSFRERRRGKTFSQFFPRPHPTRARPCSYYHRRTLPINDSGRHRRSRHRWCAGARDREDVDVSIPDTLVRLKDERQRGGGDSMCDVPTGPLEARHAAINGIRMYYEVHGRRDGVPLVLLHGGGSTIEVTFGTVLPIFARRRMVIALEEQGHGRTTDRDAPVTFESSADDVAALLRHLKVAPADVFGFSNGASVALQIAIRHPQLVRKMVFASSMTRRTGARPALWEFMEQADFSNMPEPLKDAFLRVNPDEQQLRAMHDKDAARMLRFSDVPDEALGLVRAPTLIVLGDRDIVTPEHAVELTRLIPEARLLILPGGHGDYLGEAVMTRNRTRYPELTAQLIEEFLDSKGD